MNRSPTVYVVDDDAAIRDALAMLLEQHGLAVSAFDGGEAFLEHVSPMSRGCAIVDLRMTGMNGLALHAEMVRRSIPLGVVILTGHGDIPTSVNAIKGGAVDFLTKPVEAAQLVASVRAAIAAGDAIRAKAIVARSAADRLASLTAREHEVMALTIEGLANKEIARVLGISHRTVEIHRARIMHKTGVTSVLELSRMVAQNAQRP